MDTSNNTSPPPTARRNIPRPRVITTARKPDVNGTPPAPKAAATSGLQSNKTATTSGTQSSKPTVTSTTQSNKTGSSLVIHNTRNGSSSTSQNVKNGSPKSRKQDFKKLDSTSTSSISVLPLAAGTSGKCTDGLEDENSRLKIALQSEKNSLKQLRREMMVQLKELREDEQHKSMLSLKDMKSRLHFEKVRELELQKDTLNRKFEVELAKIAKVKDAEVRKLKADVQKLQDELQLSSAATCNTSANSSNHGQRGLSVGTRPFENERTKLLKEIQDLVTAKRLKEEELGLSRDKEKQLTFQVKRDREDHSARLSKLKKETDIEIRRLCDELKVKDRQLLSSGGDHGTPRQKREDTSHSMGPGSHGTVSPERRKPRRYNSSSSLQDDQSQSSWTPKSSELSSKLKVREDKLNVLEEEKVKLMARIKEMENKSKPMTEKNKKLFDKNVELSSHNKCLEDTIRHITKENEYLKSEVASESTIPSPTKRSLSAPDSGFEESYEEILKEVKTLRRQALENDKTIAALKLACAEKDRRIELILHRKRKQRASKVQNKAAGIKETYFGYDEADSQSIDSELSLSVCSSTDMIDDEEVFEDYTREDFQQNYQRLAKEHLEMERSFALLQATHGAGFVDPQRESKMRTQLESDLLDAQSRIEDLEKLLKAQGKDTGWLEEKERLNKTIRTLKEKLHVKEDSERKLSFHMEEVQEQNEVLEFRTLELEEQVEKLSVHGQRSNSVTFTGELCEITENCVLRMLTLEKGSQEISLSSLRERLQVIKEEHAATLSVDDQTSLVQAVIVVDAAEKKIKDLLNKTEALKTRISALEEEKANILSSQDGVSTDLVFEYEFTRNQLAQHQLTISELEGEVDKLQKAGAVYQYKESHFEKREENFKEEISLLKQRLSNSHEGRDYENEVFVEKINALKLAEERVKELTTRCTELERECFDLHEQLTLQDNESLTESDKDNEIRMASQQVTSLEKAEQESAKKILELLDIKSQLNNRIRGLEAEVEVYGREHDPEEAALQIEGLERGKRKLQDKVEELQALLEEEVSRTTTLEKQISGVHDTNHDLEDRLEVIKSNDSSKQLEANNEQDISSQEPRDKIHDLQAKLKETEKEVETLKHALGELDQERTRRVEWLQERLNCMEDNELKLSETIVELEEVEKDLRDKVDYYEKSNKSGNIDAHSFDSLSAASNSNELKSKMAEQNLRDRFEQMSLNEQILRENITDLQTKLEKYEQDGKSTLQSETTDASLESSGRADDLEGKVKQLRLHEGELLEQIYQMKIENQELQEHIDELIASRDESSSPESTPRENKHDRENEQLRQHVLEMESENQQLKDKLLHAKLDSMQTGKESDLENYSDVQAHLVSLEEDRGRLKELVDQLETERNVLIEQNQEIEKQLMHMDAVEQELDLEQETNKQLMEKLELLSDSEEKLMSSIRTLEESHLELRENAQEQGDSNSKEMQEYKVKINQMRSREQGFMKVIETLKADRQKAGDTAALTEELTQLRERVDLLLDAQEKMVDRIQQQEELEESLKKQLQEREDDIQDVEESLRKQLSEETRQLQDQLQQQEEVEDSLHKQLDEYKQILDRQNEETARLTKENEHYSETNEQLQEDLDQVLETQKEMQGESNQLQAQCHEQETQLNDLEMQLQSRIIQLQETADQLQAETSALNEASEKIKSLEKVREEADSKLSLLESKESDSDSFGVKLQKVQEEAQERVLVLEASHAELSNKLDELQKLNEKQQRHISQLKENLDEAHARLEDYAERERNIRNELEQVSNDYEDQITSMQRELQHSREQREEEQPVTAGHSVGDLNRKINEYEDNEKALKTKINELQLKNTVLTNSLQELDDFVNVKDNSLSNIVASNAQMVSKSSPKTVNIVSNEKLEPEVVQIVSQSAPQTSQMISKDSSDNKEFSLETSTPIDITTMQNMPKEDLMSKVHELQELEGFHRRKIREMSDNLTYLRQAVEVVTVALETDADLPVHQLKAKTKDTSYEERLNQLVKSEMSLKLRVIELEKREHSLRRDVDEAEEALQSQHGEYKSELDALESELDHCKKREAKLKTKLEYGAPGQETAAVQQLQHLQDIVLDLEASERKLKRLVKEQRERELKLKYKLEELEANKHIFGASTFKGDSAKYWDLLQTIRTLESSQSELKGKVTELQKDDVDAMTKRIGELERSEKTLKMKLELLETQEPSFLENLDLGSLDTPEAILKQRIVELEQMERHLKEQVVELEKDREELHDIARKDKSAIHELNVQLRELQLSESNLKDQLKKYDIEDRQLYSKVDALTDEKERLEEQLNQTQAKERHLNAQLQRVEYHETEISMQLQNTKDDYENQHSKLRRKVSDADEKRRALQLKINELTERVDELESIEISLKQKVRSLENSQSQHKDKIRELEKTEDTSNTRLAELEATHEVLSERVHTLEEEKSQLIYEMSDVEITKDEQKHVKDRLTNQIQLLTERTEDAERKKTSLQAQLDELTNKHVTMHARLQEHESSDKQWSDKVSYLEMREVNLNGKVEELEAQLDNATSALHSSAQFETERNKLGHVAEFHRQESERAESENQKLKERLQRIERTSRDEMASIPLVELTLLRTQAEKVADSEKLLKSLQEREKGLKEDLEKAREGKDCGHETELKELKQKAELYNHAVQAHELQKQNHEDIKKQLKMLQEKVKGGDVSLKTRSSKAIQVKLSEEYTLKNLSSEFKRALRNLGARHPEAYDDFVKLLQPAEKKVSRIHVTKRVTSQDEIEAETAEVQQSAVNQGSSTDGDVVELVETQRGEKQLWRTVERKKSVGKEEDMVRPQWSAIEKNMGDTEEMTLTINFDPEAGYTSDNSSGAGDIGGLLRKDNNTKSNDSIQSAGSLPPPLPGSIPPTVRPSQSPSAESYYLPSADEASEIEDDSGKMRKFGHKLRAKSADRDSDYSEMTAPISIHAHRTGAMAHSLDSIPDDSGYNDVDNKMLREKIVYLEGEIRKREEQIVESKEDAVKAEAFGKVKSQLLETERKLENERRQKADQEQELNSVKMKIELFEKTRPMTDNTGLTLALTSADSDVTSLQAQLQRKEKELNAKHEELEGKYNSIAALDTEREQLEKQVVDMRFQLTEFEALSLDHDDMQIKVKALTAEVKDKAKVESQLTKDNAQVRHALDSLKRENLVLREHESKYKLVREQYEAMEELKRKAQTMVTPLRAKVLRLSQQCKARDELIRRLTQQLRHYEDSSDVIRAADTVVQASQDYNRPISPLTSQLLTDLEKEIKASDMPPLQLSSKRSHAHPGYKDHFHSNSVSPRSNQSGSDVDELLDPNFINHNNNIVKAKVTQVHSKPMFSSINHSNHLIKTDTSNGATADLHIPPQASLPPVTQLDLKRSNGETSYHSNVTQQTNEKPLLYRAIKDYDPRYYSRSGHQHMELTFHEGEIIKPLGSVDTTGYLEAQCNGKVGLVPVNYLEPVKDRKISVKQLNSQLSGSANGSDQLLQIHTDGMHSHGASRSVQNASAANTSQQQQRPATQHRALSLAHPAFRRPQVTLQPRTRPTSQPAFRTTSPNQGMVFKTAASISLPVSQRSTPRSTPPLFDNPDPPSRFRVARVVGDDAVLLAWNAPNLDELTRSNGILIKGYKIFINNKDTQHITSPFMTKALVEHLNLRRPHTFSIQTLGDNGHVSPLVDTMFEDVLPEQLDGQRDHDSWLSSEADSRSAHSSAHVEGERRVFMGVYDYNPKSQSPNPELVKQELAFRMGDMIVVYGDQRSDGYYFGKVHGKKGLVPSSFVEEVAVLKSKSKRSTSSGSSALSPRYTPSVSSSNCSVDRNQLSNHSSSNRKSQAC